MSQKAKKYYIMLINSVLGMLSYSHAPGGIVCSFIQLHMATLLHLDPTFKTIALAVQNFLA